MKEQFAVARSLAALILRWHQEFGRNMMQERSLSGYERYLKRLTEFSISDLDEPEQIRALAREQISGVLEAFYAESVPEALWRSHRKAYADQDTKSLPPHLGAVGRLILDILERQSPPRETVHFHLPDGWRDQPRSLPRGHVTLTLNEGEAKTDALRSFFVELAQAESNGVGGRELLVAMNEDIFRDDESVHLSAFLPGSFGFDLATGPDALATLALKGAVEVEVVLGVRGLEDNDVEGNE